MCVCLALCDLIVWFTSMNFVDAKTYVAMPKGETLIRGPLKGTLKGTCHLLGSAMDGVCRTLDCATVTQAQAACQALEEGAGRGKGLGV